jgi:predicted nucleic acid-binding protein
MVVDSSVWIAWLNGEDTVETEYLTRAIIDDRPVLVPGLVLTEVLQGLSDDAEARRVSALMAGFPTPPSLDMNDYRNAAALYRACRARGTTPRSTIYCLLAQICLSLSVPILARDRDFQLIARVAPLKLAMESQVAAGDPF